ncbi:MAG: CNNM domain-containing protein, partial [Verrucomicrobiales bacterium]|nr:CNNM domain-containing protein [Verrucomicrobiales bacterium]
MENQILYGLAALFCLALSFMLSGMEAGVLALSRLRIRQQSRAGRYAAEVLQGYLNNPENFLWTILIGNTLATFTVFNMLVGTLYRVADRQPVLFAFVFAFSAFLFYALCDLLPKMLFRQFPNRLCLMLAIPFRFLHLALAPLVGLVTWISNALLQLTGKRNLAGPIFGTRSELRWVMQESAQSLTSEERAMIERVLDLQAFTVGSVTIPLSKVVSISAGTPLAEVMKISREKHLTRLPVWEEDRTGRRLVGIVSLRTFLYESNPDPEQPARTYVKPALFLREDLRL